MVDTSHLIDGLLADTFEEGQRDWVQRNTKFEFTPEQNSHLISKIVHEVGCVGAAGPDAQHILISVHNIRKDLMYVLRCDTRPKRVRWNKVAAFGIKSLPIDFEVNCDPD